MQRVAMYLQDKHEIREGMAYAQYAEQRGFEAMWQAVIASRAGCDCTNGRVRGSDVAH